MALTDATELKELIAMHSSHATHGGDLRTDTVTIIGATLDLQEKVVRQVEFFSSLRTAAYPANQGNDAD